MPSDYMAYIEKLTDEIHGKSREPLLQMIGTKQLSQSDIALVMLPV